MFILLYLGLAFTMISSCQPKKINDEMTLENLTLILDNSEFKGTWSTNSNQKQFNFLTVSQGTSYLTFGLNQQQLLSQLKIQFMNPKYQQNRNIILEMDLQNYDPLLRQWQGNSSINYTEHNMFKSLHSFTQSCQVFYTVRVDFQQSNKPQQISSKQAQISVSLNNDNCSISMEAEFFLEKFGYEFQIVVYCLFLSLLSFFQFTCMTLFYVYLQSSQEESSRVIKYIFIQVFSHDNGLSYYIRWLYLFSQYKPCINKQSKHYLRQKNYFYHFMIPALFYLFLSTPCDIRLLQIIWRSKIRDMNHLEQNRALTLFFIQLYSCMMIYFILSQMLELDMLFGLISALYFVPQIVLNVIQGKSPKYQSGSIYGLLLPSIFITLYFRCCPSNVRGLEPSNSFIIIWISLYLSQVSLLIIQYLFGSRFFIPKCLVPNKYNYFRSIKHKSITEDQCAICLQELYSNNEEGNNQPFLSLKLMVAPCNHMFHQDCLSYWMQIKLQCPTCRQILPSLE